MKYLKFLLSLTKKHPAILHLTGNKYNRNKTEHRRIQHLILCNRHFYRPQRSWGKVIFSEACVKNSVHREEGSPGPHPRGKLRGPAGGGVSRPTPKGEV